MRLTEFSRIKWEQARELREKGLLREAEKELKEALGGQPDHPLLKMSLATLYIKEKKYSQARTLAEELLSQDPTHAQAQYVIGELLFQEKKYKEALPYLEKAVTRDPRPYLKVRLARTLSQMDRNREAVDILENELVRDPHNYRLMKEKALILNRMGRREEALELYGKLREILPEDQFIKKEVIRLKGLKYTTERTIKEIGTALNMPSQKDDAQLRGLLAQQLKEDGRLKEAARHFEKAWESEPGNPFFLKQAGYCYNKLGRYDRAARILSEALRMDPGDFIVKGTLEKIYSTIGNLSKFVTLLEDIVHEHPEQVNLFGTIRKLKKQMK